MRKLNGKYRLEERGKQRVHEVLTQNVSALIAKLKRYVARRKGEEQSRLFQSNRRRLSRK